MVQTNAPSVRSVSVVSLQLTVAVPLPKINLDNVPLNKSMTKSNAKYKEGWDKVAWGPPSAKR